MSNSIPHGPMTCDRCWRGVTTNSQEVGAFRLVRDPGHWGSSNPTVLVLGVSKGNTQSTAFSSGCFDDVAFKEIRHRLLEILQAVGLLAGETLAHFEGRFLSCEREYAFASVVRCSLTGMDRKKRTHTAASPNVVPAFRSKSEGYVFASACVDQHIGRLPPATRTVILLGTTDSYIKHLRKLVGVTLGGIEKINNVAYRAAGVLFVHVSHPSKGNGYFGAFNRGEGTPGQKMRLASEVLR